MWEYLLTFVFGVWAGLTYAFVLTKAIANAEQDRTLRIGPRRPQLKILP